MNNDLNVTAVFDAVALSYRFENYVKTLCDFTKVRLDHSSEILASFACRLFIGENKPH